MACEVVEPGSGILSKSSSSSLRWAGGILVALGVGHLTVAGLATRQQFTDWAEGGFWAQVPFLDREAAAAVEPLRSTVAFWSGPASFAVPLILLGCLVWHLAERGIATPAWVGWTVAAWSLGCGVLLGLSPFFAALLPAGLVIASARRAARQPDGLRTATTAPAQESRQSRP